MPRTAARVVYAVALALAGAAAAFLLSRGGIDTDIYSLVGGKDGVLSELNARSAGMVRVLCADAARAEKCRAAFRFDEPIDPDALLETVRTHGRGLLSAKSRELLEKGDLARLARSVKRRDYSGVGLFPKEDDPNYFLSDFVASLQSLRPDALEEGAEILVGETRGADGAAGLARLVALAEADDGIWLSGAPFHTLIATERTKREINVLGGVSLAAVFLFGWLLFRGFRFVVPTALALLCGFVAGTAAVCFMPGHPHALTFLFGTTLVGLGVDYCYHSLAERHDANLWRNLFRALLTTCLAFVPLLFSSVAVLRQMAVFTIAGLAAIYGFVMVAGCEPSSRLASNVTTPARPAAPARRVGRCARAFGILALAMALVAAAVALSRGVRFSDDPSLFHKPAPVMARGEAKFAEVAGDMAGCLVLVPLMRWQEGNAALKAKVEEPRGEFLSAADLPRWLTVSLGGEDFLMLPEKSADGVVGALPERRVLDMRGELEALFAQLSCETHGLLAVSFAVLLVVMLAVFRRRFMEHALPVAAAVVAAFATLAALGEQITFFHALSFFIVVGLGIDYAIFHNAADGADGETPSCVVLFSFLTSLVGFGMLCLTSFPVTRSLGLAVSLGLAYSYLFSGLAGGRRRKKEPQSPQT